MKKVQPMRTPIDRRQFVAGTIASAAAWSWPGKAAADESPATETNAEGSIIDTHVYLGHWPHARLPGEEPRELVNQLRHGEIVRAWVGSFDGLFHKDIAAANERLASICAQYNELMPFGSVNPMLPDWEDDLRRCHETHHMPGVRLHPTYHGYELGDAHLDELLRMAAAANLIVQLVVWLDDTTHRWLVPAQQSKELKPILSGEANARWKSQTLPSRLVIVGANIVDVPSWMTLCPQHAVYFDTTRVQKSSQFSELLKLVNAEHILFGSGEPLHSSAVQRSLLDSMASSAQRAIAHETASALTSTS